MDFVAIDVETANFDIASICQIGVAHYLNGKQTDLWGTLINPEDDFDEINISIHGITPSDVIGAPTFANVIDELRRRLSGSIVVCHMAFDRKAISKAMQRLGSEPIDCVWLDSARVARRAWNDVAYSGYGLAALARKIGYEFRHHDALEDAKACAEILLAAASVLEMDMPALIKRASEPITDWKKETTASGNPDGEFYGEVLVFTGELSLPRRAATKIASDAGCDVAASVTQKTTILVVGDQDLQKLKGKVKSSKQIKAEGLMAQGQPIRILSESDFQAMMMSSHL